MNDDMVSFLLGIILGLAIGGFLGSIENNAVWMEDTVELGLAQYCPDTGDWAWVGDCEQ